MKNLNLFHLIFTLFISLFFSRFHSVLLKSENINEYSKNIVHSESNWKIFSEYLLETKEVFLKTTIFSDCDENPLINSINNTLFLVSVSLHSNRNFLIKSLRNSNTFVHNIEILNKGKVVLPQFYSDSTIVLNNVFEKWSLKSNSFFSSFVKSTEGTNLTFINIDMKNVVHSSKSSIIFEGGLNKYELKNNLFSNISWYFKSHSNDGEGYCQNGSGIFSQKSENCLFTYCESPYYGNILSIESFANSLIHNSSFIKCRTTRRVNFNCNFWNQNMVLEDVEFEVYCKVNDVKGGALYFKDNSAGTIRNCYFKNCTNGRNINDDDARGGAIYFDSTGSLKFIDSNC